MNLCHTSGAWHHRLTNAALLLCGWVLFSLVTAAPVLADSVEPPQTYRCDGETLIATVHRGAVDDLTIPNRSGTTLPGAFVVLQWQQQTLQLPRTNNAGPTSFTDGKWWWSLANPDHPDLRQRRGRGDELRFNCAR